MQQGVARRELPQILVVAAADDLIGAREGVNERESRERENRKRESRERESGEVAEMASLEPKRRETMTYKRIG